VIAGLAGQRIDAEVGDRARDGGLKDGTQFVVGAIEIDVPTGLGGRENRLGAGGHKYNVAEIVAPIERTRRSRIPDFPELARVDRISEMLAVAGRSGEVGGDVGVVPLGAGARRYGNRVV